MAVSSCNKEVATRLYRMLAISELEADRVKSDHASFAKLGLLTQQAQLLQRQAVQVVNKSVLKAEKDELAGLSTMSTALTTEDSSGAKRVLAVLAVNEKTQATIERDQPASAKLSLLADQVDFLQEQAQQVVDDAELNARLTEIGKGSVCRLVPGTTYFHYTQNGREARWICTRKVKTGRPENEIQHGKFKSGCKTITKTLKIGAPAVNKKILNYRSGHTRFCAPAIALAFCPKYHWFALVLNCFLSF